MSPAQSLEVLEIGSTTARDLRSGFPFAKIVHEPCFSFMEVVYKTSHFLLPRGLNVWVQLPFSSSSLKIFQRAHRAKQLVLYGSIVFAELLDKLAREGPGEGPTEGLRAFSFAGNGQNKLKAELDQPLSLVGGGASTTGWLYRSTQIVPSLLRECSRFELV